MNFSFSQSDIQTVGYGHLAVGLLMAILAGTMGKRPDGSAVPLHVRLVQGALALSLLMVGYCWLRNGLNLPFWTRIYLGLCGLQCVFVIRMGTKWPHTDAEWLGLLKRAAPFFVVCLVIVGVEVGLTYSWSEAQQPALEQNKEPKRRPQQDTPVDSTVVPVDSLPII